MNNLMEIIECVVVSCSAVRRSTEAAAERAGWRRMVKSTKEPTDQHGHKVTGRTMLGWCPACSTRHGVDK